MHGDGSSVASSEDHNQLPSVESCSDFLQTKPPIRWCRTFIDIDDGEPLVFLKRASSEPDLNSECSSQNSHVFGSDRAYVENLSNKMSSLWGTKGCQIGLCGGSATPSEDSLDMHTADRGRRCGHYATNADICRETRFFSSRGTPDFSQWCSHRYAGVEGTSFVGECRGSQRCVHPLPHAPWAFGPTYRCYGCSPTCCGAAYERTGTDQRRACQWHGRRPPVACKGGPAGCSTWDNPYAPVD